MLKILVIGNSERQAAVAGLLGKKYSVMRFGKGITREAAEASDVIVLPLPAAENGLISGSDIPVGEIFGFGGKVYIGGRLGGEFEPYRKNHTLIDYALRADFAEKNARPTAEAALMLAARENPFAYFGSRCVISGFGRIGKALAPPLAALGAEVFVLARSEASRAAAALDGAIALPFERAGEIGRAETVFNTVPSLVLGKPLLKSLAPRLVIDLASMPGGCDFAAAEELGIKAVHALSLPGRIFPETAAAATAETVISIIREIIPRNGDILNEQRT